jgi:hypothetical protein
MTIEQISKEPLKLEDHGLSLMFRPTVGFGVYTLLDENDDSDGEVTFGIAAAMEIHKWLGEHLEQLHKHRAGNVND